MSEAPSAFAYCLDFSLLKLRDGWTSFQRRKYPPLSYNRNSHFVVVTFVAAGPLLELRTRCVISFTSAENNFSYKHQTGLVCGVLPWRSQMAAIARVLSRASGTEVDVETIRTLVMFCGVGLTVSLLLASYGLDLSAGFF
jgi:hypothetical protein